ncbi:MAG: hypothetical protein JGK21_31110 [Microcoleus sp. PH2017_22_RUC_O_B]|uniref:hypothetical protein n=1 Tax=unclassified Microcoleus TaxID=2642155 RepID=UPI001DD0A587|nr:MULTISPECIES: hypothetical protein [unclassified Microcoleus]MCC3532408.1 hypothetical protein [Microcoleus sp. PH2017_21_RUC_O_A]MCC3544693.1 hypothetical protein [Microcoleus sp. PH2017_22_RUC_O_B]
MAPLDKYLNYYHTYPSLKTSLKKEIDDILQSGKYNIGKLSIVVVMVSICACKSTELKIEPIEVIADIAPPQNPCPISQVPVDRQALTDLDTTSQVEQEIKDIQKKAFELAVETAQGVGRRKERHTQASIMYQRLTELYPLISCEASKEALAITWSEARLDIGYILSDGKELARSGLYVYVQELRRKNKEK